MVEKNFLWHKIAESVNEINFSSNGLAEVAISDKIVCVARHNDTIYACVQKCPHASAPMAAGYIDALGNIVCPLHKYKFSLKNGRNVSGEGYFLKTYPIEIREGGVFIQLEERNLFKH